MSNLTSKIVVTGASGQLGQLVATELASRLSDRSFVTLGSRDPVKLEEFAAQGFETARADFDDPSSLDASFEGAETVLIISSPTPNELRIPQLRAAIDAAKRAGVKRIIYTSFTNPSAKSRFGFAAGYEDTEAYLKASGLDYTIARNSQYAENLEGTLAQSKQSDTIAIPSTEGKVAYITRADIAGVLATLLTQDGHANKTYELTGSEALSIRDIAGALSAARGKTVNVVEVDPMEYAKVLASFGLPEFLVDGLIGMYAAVAAGEYAAVSPDAAALLGRPVSPVASYVGRFA